MNTYTPPLTKTVYPDKDHLRVKPDYTRISDLDREKFFTNWNEALVNVIRKKHYNQIN